MKIIYFIAFNLISAFALVHFFQNTVKNYQQKIEKQAMLKWLIILLVAGALIGNFFVAKSILK